MSSHETVGLLEIILRLSIHGLVARQLYRGAKYYVLPWLFEQVDHSLRQRDLLQQRSTYLTKELFSHEKQLIDQNLRLVAFEKNIKKWQEALLLRQQQAAKEQDECFAALQRKREIQSENYAQQVIEKQVEEIVATEIEQELHQKMTQQQGQLYMRTVVDRLSLSSKNFKRIQSER